MSEGNESKQPTQATSELNDRLGGHCPMDPLLKPCQMYQDLTERVSFLSNLCVRAVAEGWTIEQVTHALNA